MISLTSSQARVFLICTMVLGVLSCGEKVAVPEAETKTKLIEYDTSLVGPAIRQILDGAMAEIADDLAHDSEVDADSWEQVGTIFHAYQLREQALQAYEKALEKGPGSAYAAHVHYLKGRVHLDLVQQEEAKAAFESVLALEPKHAFAHFRLAEMSRNQGRLEDAVRHFEMATSQDATLAAAWQGLGETHAELGQSEKAVIALNKVLEIQPDVKQTYYQLSQVYRDLKDGSGEETALEKHKAAKNNLRVPDPHMQEINEIANMGRSWMARGDQALRGGQIGEALDAYQQAIDHAPRDFVAMAKLGNAHLRNGDFDHAQSAYKKALEINPGNAFLLFNIGSTYMEAGLFTQAQTYFEKAMALDTELVEAQMRLADSLRLQGQWEAALETYKQAATQHQDFGPALLGKAVCHLALEQRAEAVVSLKQSWEQTDKNPVIGSILARVLATNPEAHLRDGALALSILEEQEKVAIGPHHFETKAMALAETGAFKEAEQTLAGVLASASKKGDTESLARLERQLAAYRKGQAWHTPYPKDHPLFTQKTF